jgi:ferredoxin like protein
MSQERYKYEPLPPEKLATLKPVNVDDMIAAVKYYVDEEYAHISIKDHAVCAGCQHKPCLFFCPVGVFRKDAQSKIMVGYQACVECGSCRVGCPYLNVEWHLPFGGYGVAYKFG